MSLEFFYVVIFCLLGMVFGSFFTVIGIRLPKQQTFVNERSNCDSCGEQLVWFELIPLVSYLMQSGKCSHCKQRISIMLPMVELITGLLFSYSFIQFGFRLELVAALLLVSVLAIVFVTDMYYLMIPDSILLFFLPFIICIRLFAPLHPWTSALAGSIVGFGIIALIIILSNGGIGAGDMKLFGLIGIFLGLENTLLAFFLACVFGSIISIVLMSFKFTKYKQYIPFAPYIALGTLVAYGFGNRIISWYMGYFNFYSLFYS